MPELEIAVPRPQRWDEPFGEMTERDVDRLLRIEPFRSIDAGAFPPTLPLRGILLGDTRIVPVRAGRRHRARRRLRQQCVSDPGGHRARGARAARPEAVGRDEPPQRGWLQAIAQLWQNSRLPEVRDAPQCARFADDESEHSRRGR